MTYVPILLTVQNFRRRVLMRSDQQRLRLSTGSWSTERPTEMDREQLVRILGLSQRWAFASLFPPPRIRHMVKKWHRAWVKSADGYIVAWRKCDAKWEGWVWQNCKQVFCLTLFRFSLLSSFHKCLPLFVTFFLLLSLLELAHNQK